MATQAIYSINDYIYNSTAVKPMLGKLRGQEIMPIFPIQDVPEAHALDGPYLVYTVRTMVDPEQWWLTIEEANYTINSSDLNKIKDIKSELFDVFKRLDLSAKDLNEYLGNKGQNDFTFLYVRVTGMNDPAPVDQEGNRMLMPFSIRYLYTINSGRDIA